MGTPVGTPPNLIGRRFLSELAGIEVSFAGWMAIGVPIMIVTLVFVVLWMLAPGARHVQIGEAGRAAVVAERMKLGRMSAGERNVLIAFGVAITLWILPGLLQMVLGGADPRVRAFNALVPEAVAALIGAMLLFFLPVNWKARRFTLSWEEASRIDWGIILLFGGGLAMGQLADSTGLSAALGRWVAAQFPGVGEVGLTMVFTGVAIVMSEAASNTAAANIVVPMAIAVAQAAGISPLGPGLGATFGASMGFMMPISTPPNAIVYSSGYIPIGTMMRHGIVLDIVGYVIIVTAVVLLI
jgi:sodium-dependent dicarboxylate transporter 2/3/5